jgi:hypothetical protein
MYGFNYRQGDHSSLEYSCLLTDSIQHDLNGPAFRHFDDIMSKAIKSITDLLDVTSSYDIRHIALTVMFAYLQGYPIFALKILG